MKNAVSFKLPAFWEQNANTWFAQAEAQFDLRDITVDCTKYLTENFITPLSWQLYLESPPAEIKYETIKATWLCCRLCWDLPDEAAPVVFLPYPVWDQS